MKYQIYYYLWKILVLYNTLLPFVYYNYTTISTNSTESSSVRNSTANMLTFSPIATGSLTSYHFRDWMV